MKKVSLSIMSIVLLASVITISCNHDEPAKSSSAPTEISNDDKIRRGEYLVTIMGCDDCHTPKKMGPKGPEPDMDKRLSGYPAGLPLSKISAESAKSWMLFNQDLTAAVGPWGVSYAANLTSDNAGIGAWTEEQFIKCLREGKSKGLDSTRPLLPPMPWPNYAKASDEDLKAIFSFLKSTKPISNVVPLPVAPDKIAFLK